MINFEKQVRKIFRSHVQHVIDNPKLYGINPRFFTRVRKWPIARILLVMYKMQTGTLPDILFKNFIEMDEFGDSTPSAFIQQRQKLTTEVFTTIFRNVLKDLHRLLELKRYHGKFLIACDGSDSPMPTPVLPVPDDCSPFGRPQYHMDHVNAFYDVLNHLYLAITTKPKLSCNEQRELLELAQILSQEHPIYKPEDTVIISDRGYEGYQVLCLLTQMGFGYVIRAKGPSAGILSAKGLNLPDGITNKEITINVHVRRSAKGIYHKESSEKFRPETDVMLRIRIVSSVSPSGDVQYYLTNLDIQSFSASEIGCIYRKRWQVETAFRHLKYGVGAIVFHSKFLLYQEMELYAALTLYNCVAAIINHIPIHEIDAHHKYRYKVNFKAGVLPCLHYLFCTEEQANSFNLTKRLEAYKVAIIHNRHYDRGRIEKKVHAFEGKPTGF